VRRLSTVLVLSMALAGGALIGYKDFCKPVCDLDRWEEQIRIDQIYVDLNNDGHFDKNELKKNYPVPRQDFALITFKEYGSRYLWIYPPGSKKPKYQIKGRDVGLGKFTRLYLPQDLLSCCYVEKGASRRKNEKQKPGNNPQLQKTLIRFDMVRTAQLTSSGELELVTDRLGTFVLQKDRARLEQARIMQYNHCNCRQEN